MTKNSVAKIFRNGRSQAVRLPQEFRFEGDRVRVRRVPGGVLLQPMFSDAKSWFDELDRLRSDDFMSDGQNQPVTPSREIFE